jgi:hypothetical protein
VASSERPAEISGQELLVLTDGITHQLSLPGCWRLAAGCSLIPEG